MEGLKTEADTAENNAKQRLDDAPSHSLGIFFVVPMMSEKHKGIDEVRLVALKSELSKQLQKLVVTGKYVVLRGSYFPNKRLEEKDFFPNKAHGWFGYPGVDVLICEQQQKRK